MVDPETDPGLAPLLAGLRRQARERPRRRHGLPAPRRGLLHARRQRIRVPRDHQGASATRRSSPTPGPSRPSETKPEGATLTVHRQDQPQFLVGAPARREAGQVRQGQGQAGPDLAGRWSRRSRRRPNETTRREAAEPAGRRQARPGWPCSATPTSSPTGTTALSGNGNFFLNIVNWLTEEADLISIQPKTSSPRTIQLSPSQGRLLFFVSVILLPLAVLVLGVSVWLRRRSL